MEDKTLYEMCVRVWGIEAQTDMMIEEMSELTKALLKLRRAHNKPQAIKNSRLNDLLEEMFDVEFVLNQIKYIYIDNGSDLDKEYYNKIKQLKMKEVMEKLGINE